LNDSTEHELGFTVDKTESTDEVILISLGGDVDANDFASG
jgi:hypothetical protein